jgi:hypothetical protein
MSGTAKWSLNFTEDGFPVPAEAPELSSSTEHDNISSRISIIALIVIGILVLATSLCLIYQRSKRDQDQDEAQEQDAAAPLAVVAMGKAQRKATRYAEVESWLISRRIEPHDEFCNKALTYLDSPTYNPKELKHGTSSINTVCTDVECGSLSVDEETECPVCIDALEVGDLVSWSPNAQCEHVFHHCCIKEWLLEQECCPCCRQIFLPAVSQHEGLSKSERTEELLLGQQQLAAKRFFCIRHGVVTLSEPELCFTKKCELEQMFDKVHRVPSRTELAAIRGCRIEHIDIDSSYGVDRCVPLNVDLSEDAEIPTEMISYSVDEELAEPKTSSELTDDDNSLIAETPSVSTDEEHAT